MGPTEWIIVSTILLVIFGRQLPNLPRSLRESVEAWRRPPSPNEVPNRRYVIFLGLMVIAYLIVSLADISAEQMLAVVAVGVIWLVAGFYCFGRKD